MKTAIAWILLTGGAAAQEGMYPFAIEQDRVSGIADFSYLNHPLTPADRVFVGNGHFCSVGPDLKPGTPDDRRIRFFGVNLAFGANFPEPADARRIAGRLRRLGVNLVRLHHMDSSPDSDPKRANSILTTGPYPTLNPESVTRLRRFLDELKSEGIYINLNLHVGYQFRPDADRVPSQPERVTLPTQSKPLHIFYPRMIDLQVEFTTKVMEALGLRNDPVLAMVEINNETSLLESWQRGSLEREAVGEYRAELERQWNVFVRKLYGGVEEWANAWSRQGNQEQFQGGSLPMLGAKEIEPPKRANDFLLFLADMDRSYLRRMLGAVRQATDFLVPVAGTQMGYGGLLNLDSHRDLDYQDNHFYIDHYNFPGRAWDPLDWRIRDSSAVGTGLAPFLNMAIAREKGKPYTVSEYNQQWPNRQAAEIDPTLAAFAAFQDWDSIMHFAYSHGRDWDRTTPGGFDINGDWTKFVNIGQAAWMFRNGAVKPGRKLVAVPVSERMRLQSGREKRVGNIAGALTASVGYQPSMALLHPVSITASEGGLVSTAAMASPDSPFVSDTGELRYDRERRLFQIQAEQAAGIIGFIGAGARCEAGALEVELASDTRGFAAIVLTSMDGRPIRRSARMLLTIPGYTLTSLPDAEPLRPQKLVHYRQEESWWTLEPKEGSSQPSGNRGGGPVPVWMERIESFVAIHSNASRLTVYPLDGAGKRLAALPADAVKKIRDGFRIHLQARGHQVAPWYEIVR